MSLILLLSLFLGFTLSNQVLYHIGGVLTFHYTFLRKIIYIRLQNCRIYFILIIVFTSNGINLTLNWTIVCICEAYLIRVVIRASFRKLLFYTWKSLSRRLSILYIVQNVLLILFKIRLFTLVNLLTWVHLNLLLNQFFRSLCHTFIIVCF